MKLVPRALPPLSGGGAAGGMERLPLPLPFSPELLWRYPLGFPAAAAAAAAAGGGPLHGALQPGTDFKSHLPASLASDPRLWARDDVVIFLKWAEREFDLQPFDLDMFQMNGKALCLLTRNDLSERSPGSGDVLHNVLQLLINEATFLQRCLPSSPVTPTSRHAYPLSPHSHPPTPNWNILAQNSDHFHNNPSVSITAHFIAQNNSVTLSPAPSVDSQAGSPQHADNGNQVPYVHSIFGSGQSNGSGSNQSDSDEDSYQDGNAQSSQQNGSPPNTPGIHGVTQGQPPRSPKDLPTTPVAFRPVAREFFPSESPEPNTNGRLLWDFLQQLLNDSTQRYTNYIAWKNRETGVFKIVDPAGLAKLWGIQKNHLSMNYDKMSRALRYYYRVNILRKVQGERHCYQFLRNPTELKNIKNISLLRQQMSPTRPNPPVSVQQNQNITIKTEPEIDIVEHKVILKSEIDDEEMPTDLRMHQPTDLSSRHSDKSSSSDSNTRDAQYHSDIKQT